MTAKLLTELLVVLVAVGTLVAMAGKALRAVLGAFHNEHVAPAVASLTTAIAHNSDVTATQTAALAHSIAAQEKGFERLGDIIEDHEHRLTILEQPNPKSPVALRPKRKAS
jgi:prephenate dehydratase